jgi:hypothetical protein
VVAFLIVRALLFGIVVGGRFGGSRLQDSQPTMDLEIDLPCPWCYSQTNERDQACRSCGRRFGADRPGEFDAQLSDA